jgi:hypothetical protein
METVVEKNVLHPEFYVVEIDGKIRSAYGIFVEALKAGLELKQKFPHSRIKVHDADHVCTEHQMSVNRGNGPDIADGLNGAD